MATLRWRGLEQLLEPGSNQAVILRDHHPDHGAGASTTKRLWRLGAFSTSILWVALLLAVERDGGYHLTSAPTA